jgi:hypothetical protein
MFVSSSFNTYVNLPKKKTNKKEKREKQKKNIPKDVYWILPQKTKQEKSGSNQLRISSNFIL